MACTISKLLMKHGSLSSHAHPWQTMQIKITFFFFIFGFFTLSEAAKNNEILIQVDTKLHRISVLLKHLQYSIPFRIELQRITEVIQHFELIFYCRKHMRLWCDDPMQLTDPKEILVAAYQRDTVCPFHENYKLVDLPILQEYGIITITDFKNHPDYNEMVADLQAGDIKFANTIYHKGHQEYIKNNTAKYFARSVEADLENVLEKQMGLRMSYKEIAKRYKCVYIESQYRLNAGSAKAPFIRLPYVKFELLEG